MVNWLAVLYGVVTGVVIGLASGLGLPFTEATVPVIGQGATGLIAGGVAGYAAHEGLASGALHGLLATAIGGLVVAAVLLVLGTLTLGLLGFGVALTFLVVVLANGIPGAVGGAVGGLVGSEGGVTERTTA
jgi:hypothetical protein